MQRITRAGISDPFGKLRFSAAAEGVDGWTGPFAAGAIGRRRLPVPEMPGK
jgi:hypothetical protein